MNTVGTYDTFGAVILLLVLLNGTAFVLLVGASVNVVIGEYHPEGSASPSDGRGAAGSVCG